MKGEKEYMLKNNPLLYFFIKLILIFTILAAPFSVYDQLYGKFYRASCKLFFNKFNDTGIAIFKETREKFTTHVDVGNLAKIKPNGAIDTATADFNTRYRGYIPTVLFFSLVLASPVSAKRKFFALLIGLLIITSMIMLKQWIHILYLCEQSKNLGLYDFTPEQGSRIHFLYLNFSNYNGPSLIFSIAAWILIVFRKKDIELLK